MSLDNLAMMSAKASGDLASDVSGTYAPAVGPPLTRTSSAKDIVDKVNVHMYTVTPPAE